MRGGMRRGVKNEEGKNKEILHFAIQRNLSIFVFFIYLLLLKA